MKKTIERVKKFIKDNNLDLSGEDSELNGNCVIVAGFIDFLVEQDEDTQFAGDPFDDGIQIIRSLDLSVEAENELERVFDFAYMNNYFEFWDTPEAKEQYVF